ncbi:MAG: DUF427 domain-containing protein [Deltaproteobacteria bacterium]|nr:DUF427 domain-containing protein [Deltaproteobacteria bacterium]
MARAMWKGVVVAESDETVLVEGNHYFPPDSVASEHLRATDTTTRCFWKGTARYFDVVAGDEVASDAAWSYPEPMEAAENIRGYIAFWRGVQVLP